MSTVKPAQTYPDTIFKQKTPDEAQQLNSGPRFNTWYKGWFTRSEIYERMMPDGLTSALRVEGPESGGAAMVMNSKGNIKLITGVRTEVAGSGTLDIKTHGCNQLHNGRTNIQYNEGGTENEGQALNVLAYGDVVEEVIGGERHIKATKIILTATDVLTLDGQTVKIQAQGDIELAAASITTAQVNKKDIIIGQQMSFGAGETTEMKFDPRASTNVVSTGNINHKVLGEYKIKSLRDMSVNAVTGLFISSPATTTVQGLAGMIINGPGGMNLKSAKTTFETADFNVISAKTDFKTADFNLDAAKLDLTGTGDVAITGANVRLIGALIYLN
jgi:hypothetical protein